MKSQILFVTLIVLAFGTNKYNNLIVERWEDDKFYKGEIMQHNNIHKNKEVFVSVKQQLADNGDVDQNVKYDLEKAKIYLMKTRSQAYEFNLRPKEDFKQEIYENINYVSVSVEPHITGLFNLTIVLPLKEKQEGDEIGYHRGQYELYIGKKDSNNGLWIALIILVVVVVIMVPLVYQIYKSQSRKKDYEKRKLSV